jgi:hypothetical protein
MQGQQLLEKRGQREEKIAKNRLNLRNKGQLIFTRNSAVLAVFAAWTKRCRIYSLGILAERRRLAGNLL